LASGVTGGNATLGGTVDPRGFEVTACRFEYLLESDYEKNLEEEERGFEGAEEAACEDPNATEIGDGNATVPVHADLSGLDPVGRYRFRLLAANEFGECEECQKEVGLFGPPVVETKSALPILYDEATLRAQVDPSGLATTFRFQYGTSESYEHSTPVAELQPGDGSVAGEAVLSGLSEGTE
jgi:hypothetical protein